MPLFLAKYMANEHSVDKVDAAKIMLRQGKTQESVAKVLGIAVKTIRTWCEKYKWNEMFGMWEVVETDTLEIMQYQSMAMKYKKDRLLKEGAETGNYELMSRGDIDALQKLSTIFRDDLKDFSNHSKVTQEVMEFVAERDNELAKQLIPHVTAYLALKYKAYK